jgi:hypothetical protein
MHPRLSQGQSLSWMADLTHSLFNLETTNLNQYVFM